MRSMHSSEKIEELVTELEGYRWDAILLSETWRHEPAEMWETHHNHIFMGAGKYENKHGVGIMLNKKVEKELLTPITSMSVPSQRQSWSTAVALI